MYSLQPIIATILAIPQILVFGWIISNFSFSLALAGVGLVSFLGVLLIRHGLKHPKPAVEGETWGSEEIKEEHGSDEYTKVEQLASSTVEE